jgi:hypothetical protein
MSDYKKKLEALEKHYGIEVEDDRSIANRSKDVKAKAKRNLDSLEVIYDDVIGKKGGDKKEDKADAKKEEGKVQAVVPVAGQVLAKHTSAELLPQRFGAEQVRVDVNIGPSSPAQSAEVPYARGGPFDRVMMVLAWTHVLLLGAAIGVMVSPRVLKVLHFTTTGN